MSSPDVDRPGRDGENLRRMHGLVSLKIAGNLASMGIDLEQVFEIQLATLTA